MTLVKVWGLQYIIKPSKERSSVFFSSAILRHAAIQSLLERFKNEQIGIPLLENFRSFDKKIKHVPRCHDEGQRR